MKVQNYDFFVPLRRNGSFNGLVVPHRLESLTSTERLV